MTTLMTHAFEKDAVFPAQIFPSLKGGQAVSLEDYRGHKVVLHVFASW